MASYYPQDAREEQWLDIHESERATRHDAECESGEIQAMPSYILRNIEDALWARVKARAQADGRHLRGLLLWLLTKYADGEIK